MPRPAGGNQTGRYGYVAAKRISCSSFGTGVRSGNSHLSNQRVERRLMAILAADVAGYSRLVGADEEGSLALWKAHWHELIQPKIAEHDARIVRITGDGLLIEFASAVTAVRCAAEIQRAMLARNADLPRDRRLEFRMGIHVGDIIVDGGDMWGDGVNVTARLESLSDPGGICVSSRVYEDVCGRVDATFEDLGERQLKNIARPLRIYRVQLEKRPASTELVPPDQPSIVVLPFDNRSEDPGQAYFAEGIAEEIATALSRMRWLQVTARHPSSADEDRALDAQEVGRTLGVRYVLKGSVRKAADRAHVAAQLVDALSGAHLWAETFETMIEDAFELQAKVTATVVGAIAPKLDPPDYSPHRPTRNPQAYDYYLRGLASLRGGSKAASSGALELFDKAIELDPDFTWAHGMAAWCYLRSSSAERQERQRRASAAAEADAPPSRPFLGVPPRISVFTGRVQELEQLDAILFKHKAAAVTQQVGRAALQGLGGVGKTTLAIEYAHHFRTLYDGVCWCPAETRLGLLSSLANIMVSMGVGTPAEADVEKAARAALRWLAEQRATWLLVYDNTSSPEEIADLLPPAGANVLITSRFSDWNGWAEEVPLDVLLVPDAISLLQKRAGRGDAAGAALLAEALGNLPLALEHAAAYCKRTQMSFADYAAKAASLVAAVPRGASYPRSVSATFDLAIAEAAAQCSAAEQVIAFLAHCSPERVPMLLIEGAVDGETERLQALTALVEVSLIKHDPFEDGTPAVRVHRLVQSVARSRSSASGSAHDAAERLIVRLAAIYPGEGLTDPHAWPLCAQLTPHVLALQETCRDPARVSAGGADLLRRAGKYFHGRAVHGEAAQLFRDALAVRESALGPVHPATATSLDDLADLLRDQGDFAKARPLHERALAIREEVLGPDHPDTATSLNDLAILLKAQGDFAGALPLYRRALAIRERVLGAEHPATARSLNNLANLLRDQGEFAAARPLYERALAIRERALGPDHSDTATSLNNLAVLLRLQGDFAAARPLLERALRIYEKALGEQHPAAALTLNQLGLLLEAQGHFGEARPLYERALAIREQALGPEHPATARSLNNLAIILKRQGDLASARSLHERALGIHEKVLGPKHPHTATSLDYLADARRRAGDLAEALALYDRALAIRERTLGPEHFETASTLDGLAVLFATQGDTERARALMQHALAIRERVFGPEHLDTAESLDHLAALLQSSGDIAAARPLCVRALVIRKRFLGPDHPDLAATARRLGELVVR